MEQIALLDSNLLDENHILFNTLKTCPPKWWNKVKNDPELYIEIRKNNIIDIYFRGGRMAELKMGRDKKISVTAHPKYLEHTNKEDSNFYKKNDKNEYIPIYQDCEKWIEQKMSKLKENIIKYYSGKDNGENTSEKLIQGELIIKGRDKYLDSEFAHRFHVGKRETIRIDLVKIENNEIIFEELKRIGDYRLRTKDGNPEILTQMKNYREFLLVNRDRLCNYYKRLYRIKRSLGLPLPSITSEDKLTVNIEPLLIIAQNYEKESKNRTERINDIIRTLSTIQLTPKFF